jgi:hypothetical protein
MRDAFIRAGVSPLENEFLIALAKYLANGGTVQRAYELIELSGEKDRLNVADKACCSLPLTRQPYREEADQSASAAKASGRLPAPREPSVAARNAARTARAAAAQSVLDTFKISIAGGAGLVLGDIPVDALPRLIATTGRTAWITSRQHHLLHTIKSHVDKQAHIPKDAKVRDVIRPDLANQMIDSASSEASPIGYDKPLRAAPGTYTSSM